MDEPNAERMTKTAALSSGCLYPPRSPSGCRPTGTATIPPSSTTSFSCARRSHPTGLAGKPTQN